MGEDDVAAMWEANAAAWVELSRAGYDVNRDIVNTPAFLDMFPDVTGLVARAGDGGPMGTDEAVS